MKRVKWLAWIVSVALLAAMLPVGALAVTAADTSVKPGEKLDMLTTYGRTYVRGKTLWLYWTNSGVAFRFNGTGASASLATDNLNPDYLGFLNVYVDGEFTPSQTITLEKASGTFTLAEGLAEGEHTVELRKRNEPEAGADIGVKSITITGGDLIAPPEKPARRIEFVGDSITCGFGNMVNDGRGPFRTPWEDGTMTYAVLAAKQLGADVSIVARSGIGFCRNIPDRECIYEYYDKTAALRDKTGSAEPWDFENEPNDVVVINLGTNDNSAQIDGKTISDEFMTGEAVAMMKLVREKNPNAVIIWAYGMMGEGRRAALSAAAEQLAAEGDDKVFYLPLETGNSVTEFMGTGNHPSIQTDINRSLVLARFVAEKTGWEIDTRPMLQAQLQYSAQFMTDEERVSYTEDSFAPFAAAMAAGEATLSRTDATVEEYTKAANDIWQVQQKLLKLSDVSAEVITVHTMDTAAGWTLVGDRRVDTEDYKEGAGALSTTWVSGGMVAINTNKSLNITLPSDWQDWYLECWMYVDHPENIPSGSCIEISEIVDQIEVQWGLDGLGLQPGWNKVQLKMGGGSATKLEEFKTLKNIRMFIVNMTEGNGLTFKVDNIVLSRGKVAADKEAWQKTLTEAETLLAEREDAALRAAYALAQTAETQADVNAFTARLTAAIDAYNTPQILWGDANRDEDVTTADARAILQCAAELKDESEIDMVAADVVRDGEVTTADARAILQYCAEIIDTLPVED